MIQCSPHGITNSTLLSVRVISPTSSWIRDRGTSRCTPFDMRTRNGGSARSRARTSSVHTPSALITRRAADYVDRLLRGAKVAYLPVQFPTKFELVVNLKTAKAIGLTIREAFLLRADEIIE